MPGERPGNRAWEAQRRGDGGTYGGSRQCCKSWLCSRSRPLAWLSGCTRMPGHSCRALQRSSRRSSCSTSPAPSRLVSKTAPTVIVRKALLFVVDGAQGLLTSQDASRPTTDDATAVPMRQRAMLIARPMAIHFDGLVGERLEARERRKERRFQRGL